MFVKTSGSEALIYPYNLGMLRRDNPRTGFPKNISDELMNSYGVFRVQKTDKPVVDRTKKIVEGLPQLVDGVWVQSWIQEDLTQDEIDRNERNQAFAVRKERSKLLSETDWVTIKALELGETVPPDWAMYRQALRDITDHENFPFLQEADWPVKPE